MRWTSRTYKVELTTLAQEQILEIAQYITEELMSPDAANRLVDKLESEISKLATMPERIVLVNEEPWHSKGVRKYIIEDYIAYFIIIDPECVVRVRFHISCITTRSKTAPETVQDAVFCCHDFRKSCLGA